MSAQSDRPQLFNLRVVAGLIVAGILAFGAFMLLAAYAGDFRSGRDGRAHPLSVAATGYKGLVDLIGHSGGKARLIRSEEELQTEDLVIVALEENTNRKRLATLLEARATKYTLLVLPKWQTVPDEMRSGWVYSAGQYPPGYLAGLLRDIAKLTIKQDRKSGGLARGREWYSGVEAPTPGHPQFIAGEEMRPLLSTDAGDALIVQVRDQPLYILADADLLNNHGLRNPRSARGALDIIEALNVTEGVAFDLTLSGFGKKPNALKLLFEPPFLALTVALFVAALLAGLHGAFRFGPERREERAIALGKAALVENSAGLVRLVRREHRAGGAYVDLVAEEAARASGAPAALKGRELAAYLDRLSRPGDPTFSQLSEPVREADSRSSLVSAARALFWWKKELIQ